MSWCLKLFLIYIPQIEDRKIKSTKSLFLRFCFHTLPYNFFFIYFDTESHINWYVHPIWKQMVRCIRSPILSVTLLSHSLDCNIANSYFIVSLKNHVYIGSRVKLLQEIKNERGSYTCHYNTCCVNKSFLL